MNDPGGQSSELESVSRGRVLVVDDDEQARRLLQRVLTGAGYLVDLAPTGEEGLAMLGHQLYDVALLDLQLPGLGGMELLAAAPAFQTDSQFIVMTGEATVDRAVEAMKLGAYDFLRKPLHMAELQLVLERALEERDRRREIAKLRLKTGSTPGASIVGKSPALRRMFDLMERVAPTRATVLITGETGTGKELVAQTIHSLSDRARKPFVAVNCSALSESLLESELFGHMKGSFTGATESRRGLFEEAGDGTMFLDEVGTISQSIQVKLLRVLQERRVQRVGGSQPIPVAFRLIAATNVDLTQEVAAGRFREDLFYRLNVFAIAVPPLRDRKKDIPLLAKYFVKLFSDKMNKNTGGISKDFLQALERQPWKGNIRELRNVIERAVILEDGPLLTRANLPLEFQAEMQAGNPMSAFDLASVEKLHIQRVLNYTKGNKVEAAKLLNIGLTTVYRKMEEYGLS